jgi:hypothetical protein
MEVNPMIFSLSLWAVAIWATLKTLEEMGEREK